MSDGKLVRDRIPDIIRATGREPVVRTIKGDELFGALLAKVAEEAEELRVAVGRSDQTEELADLLEVVLSTAQHLGIRRNDLDATVAAKRDRRGGFANGYWLVT